MKNNKPYATSLICLGILAYWIFVAFHSSQSLFETQHSRLLLSYGAVNGQLLDQGGYWRLIISQFTHVKFFHMIGNLAFIFLIGTYIERRFGLLVLLLVYFVGGAVGQYASVLFNPDLVSSGASQALCSLSGFSLVQLFKDWRTSKIAVVVVLLFISIQCGLDLYFAERLKEGHTFGFLAGGAMSLCMFWKANLWLVWDRWGTRPHNH
jgi:rhomboid protease GluP